MINEYNLMLNEINLTLIENNLMFFVKKILTNVKTPVILTSSKLAMINKLNLHSFIGGMTYEKT